MLSVKPVCDSFLFVDLVQDPVSILPHFKSLAYVLHRSCEDNNLVDLAHFFEELVATRSNQKVAFGADLHSN